MKPAPSPLEFAGIIGISLLAIACALALSAAAFFLFVLAGLRTWPT